MLFVKMIKPERFQKLCYINYPGGITSNIKFHQTKYRYLACVYLKILTPIVYFAIIAERNNLLMRSSGSGDIIACAADSRFRRFVGHYSRWAVTKQSSISDWNPPLVFHRHRI